jgi:hypothetical protein
MARTAEPDAGGARAASREEISALLYDASEAVLESLLENPRLDEAHLCLLLERKVLSGELLERIGRRKQWLRSYRVKRHLAFHAHTPRLLAMRLVRELYLMDLVQLSLLPSAPAELRRLAEELILARLPQLPLGQKLALARRGSARVAAGLVAEGHEQVVRLALENAFLTEAQVLKVLSREKLPARVVAAIAGHRKWSQLSNVRMGLVRHPLAPLARTLSFLPDLTLRELQELCEPGTLTENLRRYVDHEIARRAATEDRSPRFRTG